MVYEGGFAFIEESRSVRVRKGASRLSLDDLPDGVQPDTIVASFPKGGAVLKGQRFRQASTGLLQAFVGKMVSIASRNPVTGVEDVRNAKLLRARPSPLIELDGRIELTVPGRIALPNLPPDTLLRASLVLDLEASRTEKQSYRLSYMTTGPGWSADYALNLKSRKAAQRLGLSYEGVFRQAIMSKGRNRDTAWFAAIDKEWPSLKVRFEQYLSSKNFTNEGGPRVSLTELNKPYLFKEDNHEFS